MKAPLHRIILYVSDLERSAAFYQRAFGFERVGATSEDWIELDAGPCRLALVQEFAGHHSEGGIHLPADCPVTVVFQVENVVEAREHLVGTGVEMGALVTVNHIDLVYCDGIDPDGHRIQICNR